jgi:predicted RNase H-related nuclease YkuK (DUF458 family)
MMLKLYTIMSKRVFRTNNGRPIEILSYTLNQIKENPDTKIYFGGDSKLKSNGTTVYYTVVAYRYGSRGVHYVYNKEVITHKMNKWERLMGEIERIMNFATWFTENSPVRLYAIDFDLNQDKKYYSNKLVNLATGWGDSLGVRVYTKPDEVVASKAADHLTNKY